MPHCILEYSTNVVDQPDLRAVLRERAYPETLARTRCSLTVQVNDLHRASYRRTRTYED